MTVQADVHAIADEVITSLADHRQITTFSSRAGGLTLSEAYRVTPLLRAAFEARGETITGRKVGFTNRQMWQAFGVAAPVWGYATSRTTHDLSDVQTFALDEFSQPRIEPEIMFGLGAVPTADMSDAALLDCVAWIALGYEIVQSIFPDWKFAAADTVAANGLHGALLIGPRHPVAPRRKDWEQELPRFEVELYRDGELVQRGAGSLVLESPLNALRHLVALLADDSSSQPLRPGDVVSTGTLTLPMPVRPGERWTTKVAGIPLQDIIVQFG